MDCITLATVATRCTTNLIRSKSVDIALNIFLSILALVGLGVLAFWAGPASAQEFGKYR